MTTQPIHRRQPSSGPRIGGIVAWAHIVDNGIDPPHIVDGEGMGPFVPAAGSVPSSIPRDNPK